MRNRLFNAAILLIGFGAAQAQATTLIDDPFNTPPHTVGSEPTGWTVGPHNPAITIHVADTEQSPFGAPGDGQALRISDPVPGSPTPPVTQGFASQTATWLRFAFDFKVAPGNSLDHQISMFEGGGSPGLSLRLDGYAGLDPPTHEIWATHFGGTHTVLGSYIEGEWYRLIARIAPADTPGGETYDVWVQRYGYGATLTTGLAPFSDLGGYDLLSFGTGGPVGDIVYDNVLLESFASQPSLPEVVSEPGVLTAAGLAVAALRMRWRGKARPDRDPRRSA